MVNVRLLAPVLAGAEGAAGGIEEGRKAKAPFPGKFTWLFIVELLANTQ